MKKLSDIKRELLEDPETRAEYEAQANEFAIARELLDAPGHVPAVQDGG